MQTRKTKIVCTIGPAVGSVEKIKELIRAGMNVARFNFSHGTHETQKQALNMVKQACEETGAIVGLLLDTKGPEIRTGLVKNGGSIKLEDGEKLLVTVDGRECTVDAISISYTSLPREVKKGNKIYIADGLIELDVEEVIGDTIRCIVKSGGIIGSKKNVNIRGIKNKLPAITEKDVADILFGIEEGFDFIAASFIRKASDILEIRELLKKNSSKMKIIAKIEDEEGVENIDHIIDVSDGIMVARGDLGVQIETEKVPLVQKQIIKKCNREYKLSIVATQMLDSMIRNSRPTRAEASDVANAVFDGTDAVMLSGETASGEYPIEAVSTMHNIVSEVEASEEFYTHQGEHSHMNEKGAACSIARAAKDIAKATDCTAIITPTLRGNTPSFISKFKPKQPIIAITPDISVMRKLTLCWGVIPIRGKMAESSDSMLDSAIELAVQNGYVKQNDKVVSIAGVPINSPEIVNMIRLHNVNGVFLGGQN